MRVAAHEDWASRDLAIAVGEDEALAQEAFARLWDRIRPAAIKMLVRKGVSGDDSEDIAQRVSFQIWRTRKNIQARTGAGWYSLVRTSVGREAALTWSQRRPDIALSAAGEVPDEDIPFLDSLMVASEERRRIYEAADELWLGQGQSEHDDLLIGAAVLRLVLVEDLLPEEAASMFGATFEDVERWLDDPAVVTRALFARLCWPGDDLAGHVLRPDRPLTPDELDTLKPDATVWPTDEAPVVCWRARHGLREEQILHAAGKKLDRKRLDEVLRKFCAALPFRQIARDLKASLAKWDRSEAISEPGLWKRIAFEYTTVHELPYRQIVERAGPPAEEVNVRLDDRTLNNWLSMGRLYAQLAAYLAPSTLEEEA